MRLGVVGSEVATSRSRERVPRGQPRGSRVEVVPQTYSFAVMPERPLQLRQCLLAIGGSMMSDDQNDNRLNFAPWTRNRGGARQRNSCRRCRRGSGICLEKRKSPQGLQRRLPTPRRSAKQGYCRRCNHPLSLASCMLRPCDRRSDSGSRFRRFAGVCVNLDDDRFSVKPAHATTPWRTGRREDSLGTMAIVGGGAAGFAAADAIRKIGWRGGVTIFSDEAEQPYDRTLLTKDYLEGAFGDDRLPIARHSLVDLGVDFEGAASVQQIEPEHKRLRLANGGERPYKKLLLATGAAPRRLDVPGADLPHVMMLRSLQDCRRILANVTSSARVAVVGGSFIAMEAAASLFGRGLAVEVIAPEEHPLEKVFGREPLSVSGVSTIETVGGFRVGRISGSS